MGGAEHAGQWPVERRDMAAALRDMSLKTVVRHVLDLWEVACPVDLGVEFNHLLLYLVPCAVDRL